MRHAHLDEPPERVGAVLPAAQEEETVVPSPACSIGLPEDGRQIVDAPEVRLRLLPDGVERAAGRADAVGGNRDARDVRGDAAAQASAQRVPTGAERLLPVLGDDAGGDAVVSEEGGFDLSGLHADPCDLQLPVGATEIREGVGSMNRARSPVRYSRSPSRNG